MANDPQQGPMTEKLSRENGSLLREAVDLSSEMRKLEQQKEINRAYATRAEAAGRPQEPMPEGKPYPPALWAKGSPAECPTTPHAIDKCATEPWDGGKSQIERNPRQILAMSLRAKVRDLQATEKAIVGHQEFLASQLRTTVAQRVRIEQLIRDVE